MVDNDEYVNVKALSSSRQLISISQVEEWVRFCGVGIFYLGFSVQREWGNTSLFRSGQKINKYFILLANYKGQQFPKS